MSYDGRLMRQALARFDEDKQRRAENFRARERAVYTKWEKGKRNITISGCSVQFHQGCE